MLDARVGEHPLEVGLADDEYRRDRHGKQAKHHQQLLPERGPGRPPSRPAGVRRMARKAQLSSAPESKAEMTEGASLWASGSQVCRGASPILVP